MRLLGVARVRPIGPENEVVVPLLEPYFAKKPPEMVSVAEEDWELVADEIAVAVGEDGREAGETCPLLLVIVSRELSDAAAVRSDGAKDGGSHDPSRVESMVVAMKKSIPGKTPGRRGV